MELAHWKDPVQSLLLFVFVNLFLYLITCGEYTVLSLVCHIMFWVLMAALAYSQFALWVYKNNNALQERFQQADFSVSESFLQKHIDVMYRIFEDVRVCARDTLFGTKDLVPTLKAIGAIYVLGRVASCFSGLTLFWIGFIISFTFPPVYELKKQEIDKVVGDGLELAKKYYNEVAEKVPFLASKEKAE